MSQFSPIPPTTLAATSKKAYLQLPRYHYNYPSLVFYDADIIIRLSSNPKDTLFLHSRILASRSFYFFITLKEEWDPVTSSGQKSIPQGNWVIKYGCTSQTLARCYGLRCSKDGMYTIERCNDPEDPSFFSQASVSANDILIDGPDFANYLARLTEDDDNWDAPPRLEWLWSPQCYTFDYIRNHVTFFTLLYDCSDLFSQVPEVKDDIDSFPDRKVDRHRWRAVLRDIADLAALADFYDALPCLETAMWSQLSRLPPQHFILAQEPEFFLLLTCNILHDASIYDEAQRHAVGKWNSWFVSPDRWSLDPITVRSIIDSYCNLTKIIWKRKIAHKRGLALWEPLISVTSSQWRFLVEHYPGWPQRKILDYIKAAIRDVTLQFFENRSGILTVGNANSGLLYLDIYNRRTTEKLVEELMNQALERILRIDLKLIPSQRNGNWIELLKTSIFAEIDSILAIVDLEFVEDSIGLFSGVQSSSENMKLCILGKDTDPLRFQRVIDMRKKSPCSPFEQKGLGSGDPIENQIEAYVTFDPSGKSPLPWNPQVADEARKIFRESELRPLPDRSLKWKKAYLRSVRLHRLLADIETPQIYWIKRAAKRIGVRFVADGMSKIRLLPAWCDMEPWEDFHAKVVLFPENLAVQSNAISNPGGPNEVRSMTAARTVNNGPPRYGQPTLSRPLRTLANLETNIFMEVDSWGGLDCELLRWVKRRSTTRWLYYGDESSEPEAIQNIDWWAGMAARKKQLGTSKHTLTKTRRLENSKRRKELVIRKKR